MTTLAGGLAVVAAGVAAGSVNTIVGSGSLITFPRSVSGAIGYRRELHGQRDASCGPGRGLVARRGAHGGPALLLGVYAGVYGGYFGAAYGVITLALLGIFIDSVQRLNGARNVLGALVNGVSALLFAVVADVAGVPPVCWRWGRSVAARWRQGRPTRPCAGPAGVDRRGGRHRERHPAGVTARSSAPN